MLQTKLTTVLGEENHIIIIPSLQPKKMMEIGTLATGESRLSNNPLVLLLHIGRRHV